MAKKPTKPKPLAPLASRVKTDPTLLARALRDPGLRSKLPDKYLSPDQLQARQRRTYLADLGDIATPLAGQSLVNAARQTVDADYAPLLSQVGQQEQIVNKSAGLQGDWAKRYYGDLNSLIGGIGTQQGTANAAALKGVADRGLATRGAIGAADSQAQQRLAADAAVRGGGLDGGATAALAAATGSQQAQAATETQRAQQSAQNYGDAQAAFLRGLQGAAAQQGGEYQQQIGGAQAQALAKLAQDRSALQTRQGGAFTDTLLKLRQNETQNAITAAGLDIDRSKLAASLQPTPGEQKTQAELDYFKQHGYWPATGAPKPKAAPTGYGPGGPGMNKYGFTYDEWTGMSAKDKADARKGKGGSSGSGADGRATNVQVGTAQDGTTGALSDAKTLYEKGIRDRHKLASILLKGQQETSATVTQKTKDGSVSRKVVQTPAMDKHDALWTSVALDVLIDGHVSRYNASRLHARGLKVEDLGYPTYTDYKKKGGGGAQLSPSERAPGGT